MGRLFGQPAGSRAERAGAAHGTSPGHAVGALEDATGTSKDSITAELERLSSTSDVEDTLAKLRAEVGGAPEKPAVEAPKATGDTPVAEEATIVEEGPK